MAGTRVKEDVQGTRELLDELDALMDQMLSLPIDEEGQDPSADEPSDGPAAPPPTVIATVTMLDEDPESLASSDESSDETDTSVDAPQFGNPSSTERTQDQALSEAVVQEDIDLVAPEMSTVGVPLAMPMADVPNFPRPSRWSPTYLGLRFLLSMNEAFDRTMLKLGKPGRLLCGPGFKTFLGMTGLLCLLVALLWLALDVLGWN